MPIFYERKNENNYSLGGLRLWVNELLDASVTPVRYSGFVDLGCIEEAPIAQALEFQEHFCAATGTRLKDRKIVKQISATINCTLIEPNPENLRYFFLGGAITPVAAAVGGGAVIDEVVRMASAERKILKNGKNATAIVVTHISGAPTYVLNTDYTVEVYFGFSAVRRVVGGAITEGQYVLVDYTYDILESKNFNPLTNILKTCQVKLIGASDTGNEFIAEYENCQINPNGDFNWTSDDFTKFGLSIEILDNSVAAPTAPFGVFKHLGTGANI